ncbi:hypothetical protein NT04LM_3747, partial [Listeria monocytogenes FSL F2-208]
LRHPYLNPNSPYLLFEVRFLRRPLIDFLSYLSTLISLIPRKKRQQ